MARVVSSIEILSWACRPVSQQQRGCHYKINHQARHTAARDQEGQQQQRQQNKIVEKKSTTYLHHKAKVACELKVRPLDGTRRVGVQKVVVVDMSARKVGKLRQRRLAALLVLRLRHGHGHDVVQLPRRNTPGQLAKRRHSSLYVRESMETC